MFSQALHLSVHDIPADQRVAPSRIQVNIRVSRADPFRQGCVPALGQRRSPLCPVEAMLNFLEHEAARLVHCSLGPMVFL
jgi:hypothetical protein